MLAAQSKSDTIYHEVKAEVRISSTLDSLGFSKANVIYQRERPTGYLYLSNDPADGNHYRFAFKKGKKWRSWLTSVDAVEKGSIKVMSKDVDDIIEPEIIIWEMDVNGKTTGNTEERYLNYSVHIWNTATATQLLFLNYRFYSSIDLNLADSVPAGVSGFTYDITISNEQLLLENFRDNSVYPDPNGTKPQMPYATGTYRLSNGYWIKSAKEFNSKTVEISQPFFQPYWEKPVAAPVIKPKDRFKEWIKKHLGKKKK